jgi:hypothetical protein
MNSLFIFQNERIEKGKKGLNGVRDAEKLADGSLNVRELGIINSAD